MTLRTARSVCVYCGSGTGRSPSHAAAAVALGERLAQAGIGLVYGGGGHGLMGLLARATMAAGGRVTGIIPEHLVGREGPPTSVTELVVVRSLHERKMLMFERSDGFIALPGGLGTLEELVEQLTWLQLGLHDKPVIIADIGGYWGTLLALFDQMTGESYIRPGLLSRHVVVGEVEGIIPAIERHWQERALPPRQAAIRP